MLNIGDTLYKFTKTGAIQTWRGWVDDTEVCVEYGQLDGKLTQSQYTAEEKNIGKANYLSAKQQAFVELAAMYKDQIDNKHYRETIEAAQEQATVPIPMMVKNYKDTYSKMSNTLYTSVKKNGSRAFVLKGKLLSKIGREEKIQVEHLRKAVETLGDKATFDCEVFAEGLSLQRIRAAWLKPVKTDKEIIKMQKERAKQLGEDYISGRDYLGYNPNDDAPKLKFYVFDVPVEGVPFKQRVEELLYLQGIVQSYGVQDCFEFLFPKLTNSHEERMKLLEKVCSEGSEGLVHWELDGVYEFGKRTGFVAKSKPRLDAEALVVGCTEDKSGQGVLKLQYQNVMFKAKMIGTAAERAYNIQKENIGKWVNFQYEELSDKGVPTKPTVIGLRGCNDKGEPLE